MVDRGALPKTCQVAIVGAGPAGLALATELKRLGVGDVLVLEREAEAGGVPRHCGHYPFGWREFRRVLKGPDYARRLVAAAEAAGVQIRTQTTVTALHPGGLLSLSSPAGSAELQAERVVLCTGVREASRAQRFLSGTRPHGVISTGALQSMVYLHGQRPFRRPVILGSELVSFSAIMTCRHEGMKPVAMIEEEPQIRARAFTRPFPAMTGVSLVCGARDIRILGQRQVEAVSFVDAAGGARRIETDGVIVSGRFRPEAALLRMGHLEVDPGTGGPVVDQFGRASDPAYFCTGNVLRPAETSGWCWQEGVEMAARIAEDLGSAGAVASVPLRVADPAIAFVMPQRIAQGGAQPMRHIQVELARPVKGALQITSGSKLLWSGSINSRPIRRFLVPMAAVMAAPPGRAIDITIAEKG